jgi:RecA/RadA recombinase
MPAAANVVQLKELLALKVPGARLGMPDSEPKSRWPTGIKKIDALLRGGLAKGAMTELVAPPTGSGGAMIIQALLQQSCDTKRWMALIDGQDSFDPGPVGNLTLSRLLWVRCETAAQAIQSTDLILRDHNLPLIVLDIALNPSQQLRKISASTWHRFRRLIEDQFTALVLITPSAMVSSVQDRLFFKANFSIRALDQTREELLQTIEVVNANQQIEKTRKLA